MAELGRRFVGMPVDHRRKSGRHRVEIEVLDLVEDVEVAAARLGDLRHGKKAGPWRGVHVAADGDDRRESANASRMPGAPTSPAWR